MNHRREDCEAKDVNVTVRFLRLRVEPQRYMVVLTCECCGLEEMRPWSPGEAALSETA